MKRGQLATVVFFDHTAKWSGGEISLFNLVTRLDKTLFRAVVVLFEDGVLREKLDAAGIETRVVALESELNQAKKDAVGLKSALAPGRLRAIVRHLRALKRILKQERAQIAHCNSLKADILGGIAARLARVPVIWHIRDQITDDYLPPRTARAFRFLVRHLPTRIIAVSDATLGALQLPRRFLTSGRARSIHNGVVLDAFEGCAPPFERSERVIGLIGRLTRWKGQHIFLEAAAQVLTELPDVRFQIVGAAMFDSDLEYAAQLRVQARDLGLGSRVEWLGFRSDVPELIAEMDIVAHASTTGEPFGQVIIEGMAAGRPLVATRGGGVPEIVIDGETGILVPMGDANALAEALLQLLRDPNRAREMGETGRKRALERFGIWITVKRVQSVYRDLQKVK